MNEEEKKQQELEQKYPVLRHIAEANLREEFEPAEKKNCDICGEPVMFTVDGVDVPATIRIAGEEFEAMHDVDCETCGLPLRLCDDCWNSEDHCNECQERREREQWCPLCDLVCVNMTPEEKQQHMAAHKAENCACVVDLEDGSTIKPCALHPQGGSPKGLAIHRAMKAGKEGRL